MYIAKLIALVVAVWLGLAVGHVFGPLSDLPEINLIDEDYLQKVRNHELLLGFAGSLIGCIANFFLRLNHLTILIALAAARSLSIIWMELGEPDFPIQFVSLLIGLLNPFMLVGALVIGAFWVIEARARHKTLEGAA